MLTISKEEIGLWHKIFKNEGEKRKKKEPGSNEIFQSS